MDKNKEEDIEIKPCRNCKSEIQTKLRRCPYCGILNPTVTIKEILITIAGVLIVMSIFSYFIK
jgi:RNA polymerase subunit RPABC4/transcription elongation factor Spt4